MFYDFVQEIYDLKYEEEPNYLSLKNKLMKILYDRGV